MVKIAHHKTKVHKSEEHMSNHIWQSWRQALKDASLTRMVITDNVLRRNFSVYQVDGWGSYGADFIVLSLASQVANAKSLATKQDLRLLGYHLMAQETNWYHELFGQPSYHVTNNHMAAISILLWCEPHNPSTKC